MRKTLTLAAAAGVLWSLGGCGDNPFEVTWTADPDTVLLYSLSRPELNLPSGFDFVPGGQGPIVIESPAATGQWDIAVDTAGAGLALLPPGALGVSSRAGIAVLPGATFDGVQDAPSDSAAYVRAEPVPVETGALYVIRTRQVRARFGQVCVFFAKMEPLEVDVEGERILFSYDANPKCNDRSLVPDRPS